MEVRDVHIDVPDLKQKQQVDDATQCEHGFRICHKRGSSNPGSMQMIPEDGVYCGEENPLARRAVELLQFILSGEGEGDFQPVPVNDAVSPSNDPTAHHETAFALFKKVWAKPEKAGAATEAYRTPTTPCPPLVLKKQSHGKDDMASTCAADSECRSACESSKCAEQASPEQAAAHGKMAAQVAAAHLPVRPPASPACVPGGGRPARRPALVAYGTFAAAGAALLSLPVGLGFVAGGAWASAVWAVGCSLIVGLLAFNVAMGTRPRLVVDELIRSSKRSIEGGAQAAGRVMIVKGLVSSLPGGEGLLSSDVRETLGCVLIETALRGCREGACHAGACKYVTQARATRAVDFRLTDRSSGATLVVEAARAAAEGAIDCRLPPSPHVPLVEGQRVLGFDWTGRPEGVPPDPLRTSADDVELAVVEKYIRTGQEVAVMGTLHGSPGSYRLRPIRGPHNVSKFALYWGLLPYFFPTWVTGVVISDRLA